MATIATQGFNFQKHRQIFPILDGIPIDSNQLLGDSLTFINTAYNSLDYCSYQSYTVLLEAPKATAHGQLMTWDASTNTWGASAAPGLTSDTVNKVARMWVRFHVPATPAYRTSVMNSAAAKYNTLGGGVGSAIVLDDHFNCGTLDYARDLNGTIIENTFKVTFRYPLEQPFYCVQATGCLLGIDPTKPQYFWNYNESPNLGKFVGIEPFGLTQEGFNLKWNLGETPIEDPNVHVMINVVVFCLKEMPDSNLINYRPTLQIVDAKSETITRYATKNDASLSFIFTANSDSVIAMNALGAFPAEKQDSKHRGIGGGNSNTFIYPGTMGFNALADGKYMRSPATFTIQNLNSGIENGSRFQTADRKTYPLPPLNGVLDELYKTQKPEHPVMFSPIYPGPYTLNIVDTTYGCTWRFKFRPPYDTKGDQFCLPHPGYFYEVDGDDNIIGEVYLLRNMGGTPGETIAGYAKGKPGGYKDARWYPLPPGDAVWTMFHWASHDDVTNPYFKLAGDPPVGTTILKHIYPPNHPGMEVGTLFLSPEGSGIEPDFLAK